MTTKLVCLLVILLWSASCNRQHNQSPVAATPPTSASTPAAPPAADPPVPSAPQGVQSDAAPPGNSDAEVTGEPADAPSVRGGEPARTAVIPAGSRIRVRLARTLSTKTSWAGERFTAYLAAPIVSHGRVMVPRGTVFHGRVTESKRSGRLRGRAYLGLTLVSFRLHGRTYPITSTGDVRTSRSHKRRNLEWIGGSSGAGAAIGAVAGGGAGALIGAGAGAAAGTTGALITGRKNVKIYAETQLVFSLRRPVSLGG
ncbi:MAG TPA: hypothetical protein VMI94_25460 [Bryobacteraceae bacterium]|nr:hypothetical protein [Bryobacteraceae bacterium]